MSGHLNGSPSRMSAIVTDASGAEPSTTDARDAPASRIESVTKSWPIPGCIRPASRNGQAGRVHAARRRLATIATTATSAPITVAPSRARRRGTVHPMRSPTLIAPKRNADRQARPIASTSARSAASQRRRMSAENGPTASQYARNARERVHRGDRVSVASTTRGRDAEISTRSAPGPAAGRTPRARARRPRRPRAEDDAVGSSTSGFRPIARSAP